MRTSNTNTLLQILGRAGGIGSVSHLHDRLGGTLSRRQIRDHLRASACNLGAGYFALPHAPFQPVHQWAEGWLARKKPPRVPREVLIAAILDEYPRGDPHSVRRWLQQEPGRLQGEADGTVRYLPQRWRTRP